MFGASKICINKLVLFSKGALKKLEGRVVTVENFSLPSPEQITFYNILK